MSEKTYQLFTVSTVRAARDAAVAWVEGIPCEDSLCDNNYEQDGFQ